MVTTPEASGSLFSESVGQKLHLFWEKNGEEMNFGKSNCLGVCFVMVCELPCGSDLFSSVVHMEKTPSKEPLAFCK